MKNTLRLKATIIEHSLLDSITMAYIEYLEQFKKHPELILVTENTWSRYAELWPRYRKVISVANYHQEGGWMEKGKYVYAPLARMWFYEAEFIKVGLKLVEPLAATKDNEIVLTDNYYANPLSKNTIRKIWGK